MDAPVAVYPASTLDRETIRVKVVWEEIENGVVEYRDKLRHLGYLYASWTAMTDIAALVLVVLFAVQAIGTVTYLFLIGRLFIRLERKHAIVYVSLGSPSLFLNNSIQSNTRVLQWLWRKEFDVLSDTATVASAKVVRALLLALSANLAALLLAFFGLGGALHA